jgi:predicted ATPase
MLKARRQECKTVASRTSVVITGGPGAGKTTLLAELETMGYAVAEESARAIIKERLNLGLSPRPEPAAFAREILRRDIEKYARYAQSPDWVFFDRGVVEALAMLDGASALEPGERESTLEAFAFHHSVFVLPPWKAICVSDAERDQSFEEAVHVHAKVVACYRGSGYVLHEVPHLPARARAEHVLNVLTQRNV